MSLAWELRFKIFFTMANLELGTKIWNGHFEIEVIQWYLRTTSEEVYWKDKDS